MALLWRVTFEVFPFFSTHRNQNLSSDVEKEETLMVWVDFLPFFHLSVSYTGTHFHSHTNMHTDTHTHTPYPHSLGFPSIISNYCYQNTLSRALTSQMWALMVRPHQSSVPHGDTHYVLIDLSPRAHFWHGQDTALPPGLSVGLPDETYGNYQMHSVHTIHWALHEFGNLSRKMSLVIEVMVAYKKVFSW